MSASVKIVVEPPSCRELEITVHVRADGETVTLERLIEAPAERAGEPRAEMRASETRIIPLDERAGLPAQERAAETRIIPVEKTRPMPVQGPSKASSRLIALDAFRGLTILGMLLVNNIALDEATPLQLKHAEWNHMVTFADMVFPWFLLIVGISIPLGGRKLNDTPRYIGRVITRSLLLFGLGCLVDSTIYGRPVFCLGVLQLIGLAYCVGALVSMMGPWPRFIVAVLFLFTHWGMLRFYPVPGLGAGVFTASHNFVNWLNVSLDPYHMRGLFSLLTASALVLLGTLAGEIIRAKREQKIQAAIDLALYGAGLLLCGIVWNIDLPYNKTVWTASYVLFAGGAGTILLAAMVIFTDVLECHGLAFPLVVFGTNAITAYAVPILVKTTLLQKLTVTLKDGSHLNSMDYFLHSCVEHYGRVGGGWVYTIAYIGIVWLLLFAMYRRKLFVRL